MTYSFCTICKRNTCQGKRHLYTKFHQERLQRKLDKQKSEYQKYKIFIKNVTLAYDINKQPDFWCIFCEIEVKPTFQSEERQIACEHIFNHIATKNHHSNVIKYFKEHNADRKLTREFILSKDDIEKFNERILEVQFSDPGNNEKIS
ncbi:coiled-coil domain-containing protein 84 [Gigaspora margarita]|uniref:Coiled-coil domain-containing protein 84 n=1 Tax=Gigaspora margarita TaxID=4874 RepID=A0A8H3XJ01_GIGMA|nr:coiled-coil domain-containing protein 84 [Gigaspora margarita]